MFNPQEYQYQNCDGFRLAYQRSGKGEPVVLIHGITTYSFIWRKMIPYLEDNYDLIRVDLLGCGASEMSAEFDLSLKRHAEIIQCFINKLNLERPHLVGHDLGGGIAQIMAVKDEAAYKSVSLLNSVGYDYWPVQPINTFRTPIFRQLAMAAFDRGYYKSIVKRALFDKAAFTEELLDLFWSNFSTPSAKKSFLRFAKCLNNKDIMDIVNELKKLALPVLILRAEKDVFLSRQISDDLHADIPNSILEDIPASGHYMQEEAAEAISDRLITFWTSDHG